jgi:hypothetical protein
MDDPRLAALGQFTPEGFLTPGYGEGYDFFAGRDDLHGILLFLISRETMRFAFNMYGYADDELNAAVMTLLGNPNVAVQGTLDKSQAGGVHERAILASDLIADPGLYNSIVVNTSPTHQIAHTKAGILVSQGIAYGGSTNWSKGGEGTGINLAGKQPAGYVAQDNTLTVTVNPVSLARLMARLDVEHVHVLRRELAGADRVTTVN